MKPNHIENPVYVLANEKVSDDIKNAINNISHSDFNMGNFFTEMKVLLLISEIFQEF